MPELKVEVNAVPIEEINQSVTRLRKMAAPGIKTILELQAQNFFFKCNDVWTRTATVAVLGLEDINLLVSSLSFMFEI